MSLLDTMMTIREDITLFGDSKLYLSPAYIKVIQEVSALRERLIQCCGPEIEELLDEYTEAVESKEDFIAEHYFEQGLMAARPKKQKKKEPS